MPIANIANKTCPFSTVVGMNTRIPKGLNNRNPSSAYHYAILSYNEASKWSQWYLNGERFRAGNNRKSVTSRLLTVTPTLWGKCLKTLLLWNHLDSWNQTAQEWLLEGPLRTTDAYPWQKLTWPMARWAKKDRTWLKYELHCNVKMTVPLFFPK
jgi:hypothetical protein